MSPPGRGTDQNKRDCKLLLLDVLTRLYADGLLTT
jgi:hypothetical protein